MNVLKILVLAVGLAQGVLCQALEPLYFNNDGLFKIALFTDLHYGESPQLDLKSDEVQRMVLEKERPDFIVFGGDMVSGWEAKGKEGWFESKWRQLTAPAREFQIPYAVILGNHDDEGNLDRREILQYDVGTSDGLSYTQLGPIRVGGASNFFIDILSAPNLPLQINTSAGLSSFDLHPSEEFRNVSEFYTKGEAVYPQSLSPAEPEAVARLWFFDSMDRGCLSVENSWGCVAPSAIQWASIISETIPLVPTAMAFVHIPVPETLNVWEESTQPVYGRKREFSNCQGLNTGLHQFAKEHAIQAIWSGHDHVNDYEGTWEGVRIGYGRKSGYGSYFYGTTVEVTNNNNIDTNNKDNIATMNNNISGGGGGSSSKGGIQSSEVVPVQRGARIINLRQGESALHAESWIALESGEREYQKKVNKLMSDGPPQQVECRSGAMAARILFWKADGFGVSSPVYVIGLVFLAVFLG